MLSRVDYDDNQHRNYRQGRAMSPEALAVWARAFARHAPPQRPLIAVDLGSGTGRLTPTLAETFGGPVYGVEPSRMMRVAAEESSAHPAVTYLDGAAERIPLPDRTADLVLMFLSIHHVRDRPAMAREIARVLRPGGRLLVRSTFADRMPALTWHRFFPRAREIEKRMFPSSSEVVELFAAVGLKRIALEAVAEVQAPSLAAYAARIRLKAISTFEHLSEAEIAEGMARMDQAVAAEREPRPVTTTSDLLVLG
jgi:ubiquinone/menaquinone biosynthesis C-methylase UbiE